MILKDLRIQMVHYITWVANFEENKDNGNVNDGDFDFLIHFFFDDAGVYETVMDNQYDFRRLFYSKEELNLVKKMIIALDVILEKVGTDSSRGYPVIPLS